MSVASEKPTVAVSNLPQTITVLDLRHFLESQLGNDSIFALEISTERKQWKPRSFGRIQFTTLEAKLKAMAMPLTFESHILRDNLRRHRRTPCGTQAPDSITVFCTRTVRCSLAYGDADALVLKVLYRITLVVKWQNWEIFGWRGDIFTSFPCYREDVNDLILEDGEEFSSTSETVPLVKCNPASNLAYEILFQINSLVHTQKISLGAGTDLIEILSKKDVETALMVLQKMHKLSSTCYEPDSFVKTQLHVLERNRKNVPPSSFNMLKDQNHFSSYTSDFMRVTFVEEDWSKLPANAISTSIQRGIFAKPFRTGIYRRILSVLRDGIVIGAKRFQFLAFSASQLRSNSVWMFASNDKVKAEDIREWMGCFNKIRSVSKCAARMGQLFSSSKQTLEVHGQDVEIIPDIKVISDDIDYCFSDGIGKIPESFGVVAVDCDSYRKLSLRKSMEKFESQNRMLNVTKWSDSMPCYLNREIIALLSTLGVKDEVFEAMQIEQLCLLGKMLTNRDASLKVLEILNGSDSRNILGRILVGCLDETGILNYGQVYVRITMSKAELQSEDQSFFRKVDETTCIVVGKVVVTKNPCLHPGDIRVLEAIYEVELEEKGLVDCLIFPQNGQRPHPNECSGGDLDGDLYFISWDKDLIPHQTEAPMDYTGRRPRIMDHDVTLEEIQKFFVDYMINDTLGAISTAHLVHADCEPDKARSNKCLELANLHSMAVDFAKTGAPAEMPRVLKPKEFPDFMERVEKPMYTSNNVLGKLYRATVESTVKVRPNLVQLEKFSKETYDNDLEVDGFEAFLEIAEKHKDQYIEKMTSLMKYYEAETEDEMLTGNLWKRAAYFLHDNRRYGDFRDRILLSMKRLQNEAKEWFEMSCKPHECQQMASAWYHVTYHPTYYRDDFNCLSFPWIEGDYLLNIKKLNTGKVCIKTSHK
nr:rna-dependent rna polymerase 2 [Quercus suber]